MLWCTCFGEHFYLFSCLRNALFFTLVYVWRDQVCGQVEAWMVQYQNYVKLQLLGWRLSVKVFCFPLEAYCRAFNKLRRYHSRTLWFNWGSENVHFDKTYFRDLDIDPRIFEKLQKFRSILGATFLCFSLQYLKTAQKQTVTFQRQFWYMGHLLNAKAINRPQKSQNIVLNIRFSQPYSLFGLFLSKTIGFLTRCKITWVDRHILKITLNPEA